MNIDVGIFTWNRKVLKKKKKKPQKNTNKKINYFRTVQLERTYNDHLIKPDDFGGTITA